MSETGRRLIGAASEAAAIARGDHEPTDAQDHFVEFHHPLGKLLSPTREYIEQTETRIAALEAALAKQRRVNEADLNGLLKRRGTMDQMQGDDERANALREALKP